MKKTIVIGLASTLFSSLSFAGTGVCTATATAAGTNGTATGTPITANTPYCVCDGGAAQTTAYNGGSGNVIAVADQQFTKNGFIIQCSSNTIVSTNEVNATSFAVAAGSRKGNQTVQGSSAGGAVTASGKCDDAGCTATNVNTALGAAVTALGGS